MKSNFKTILFALVATLLFSLNATAQWTSNSTAVFLSTANTSKKVGIGTGTPSAKLHVKGGDFRLDNNGQFFDLKVDAAGNLKIERNGSTPAMIIGDANGNVGIGTTTVPAAKLHVRNGDLRLDQNGQFFDFKVDAAGNLKIERNGSTPAMMIGDANGNVGIGTTTVPAAKLHVRNGDFRLDRSGQFFDFKVDAAGNLKIERNGTTTAMIIGDANGNVGIGTTTVPAAKLHVRNGDFRLDQNGQYFDFKVDAAGNLKIERNGSTAAMTIGDANGNVAIGTTVSNTYKLRVNGSAYSTSGWTSSDKRFKDNIQTLDNALEKVMALRGTSYTFRTNDFKDMNFEAGNQIGFIAQELQTIFPELVKEDETGYKAVNYQAIIPVLVEAMKEQQVQIEEKDAAIQGLEARLSRLEQLVCLDNRSSDSPATATQPLEASKVFPNPAKDGEFTVQFPTSLMEKAHEVVVSNAQGVEVARKNVEAGAASVEFNLTNAPAGTYFVQVMTQGKVTVSTLTVVK